MHTKDDLENKTSRRKFIRIAAVTSGAGLLSGRLVPIWAQEKAAQIALPTKKEEVKPLKVHVNEEGMDDLKSGLELKGWGGGELFGEWWKGVPVRKVEGLVA